MRLLNVHSTKLETFYDEQIPKFAILSHTWLSDDQEVTFAQIQTPSACTHMQGFKKVEFLREQAKREGIDYVWIDTCCIDKTSSAELSEAINSMFQWYERSEVCYVYLSDVGDHRFLESRWWTRAWTLQELLAPKHVKFFNKDGTFMGTKKGLSQSITARTGIDSIVLLTSLHKVRVSAAHRMAWASRRKATRTEDTAYSLLGIFQVNMPLLYGEGQKAFFRLQEAILQKEHDQTLFAWSFNPQLILDAIDTVPHGLLAPSPELFENCGKIIMLDHHGLTSEIRDFDGAHHLDMYIGLHAEWRTMLGCHIGILPCIYTEQPEYYIGIRLIASRPINTFQRIGNRTYLIHKGDIGSIECKSVHIQSDFTRQDTSNNTPLYRNPREFYTATIKNSSSYSFHSLYPITHPQWKFSASRDALSANLDPTERRRSTVAFYKQKSTPWGPKRLAVITLEFGSAEQYRQIRAVDYEKMSEENIQNTLELVWKQQYPNRDWITDKTGPQILKDGLTIRGFDWAAHIEVQQVFGRFSFIVSLIDAIHVD